MRANHFQEKATAFEHALYGFAARNALRRGGAFVGREKSIGLRLPKGADPSVYEEVIRKVLGSTPRTKSYAVFEVELPRRGEVDATVATEGLKRYPGAVVLVPNEVVLPAHLSVALDCILDVDATKASHLAEAAATVLNCSFTPEQAEELLSYDSKLWVPAMQPGRSSEEVLRRLRGLAASTPASWQPRVEELEGYGKAKDWALDVKQDLADWRQGRLGWRDVDRGLLLSGPTGTGKTLFAGAFARSCGIPLIATSSAEWQGCGHLGDMLKAMRRSFSDAASKSPSVLFIDEFDAIGDRRSFRGHNADYNVQVVNALLELLDGASEREGVIVIAATNFPGKVDAALRRPGRLDRHIELGLPDFKARRQILSLHLGKGISIEDLSSAALATSGCSGADLEQLARDARRLARRAGRSPTTDDLRSLFPHETEVGADERRVAAVHEAGHAVVGLELGIGDIDCIVVAKNLAIRDDALGYVSWRRRPARKRPRQWYLDELAMLLAGMAAERVFYGDVFDGSGGCVGSDLQRATDLATTMLASYGMGMLCYAEATSPAQLADLRRSDPGLRTGVEELLASQVARAEAIVTQERRLVAAIVDALDGAEALTGARVDELVGADKGKAA